MQHGAAAAEEMWSISYSPSVRPSYFFRAPFSGCLPRSVPPSFVPAKRVQSEESAKRAVNFRLCCPFSLPKSVTSVCEGKGRLWPAFGVTTTRSRSPHSQRDLNETAWSLLQIHLNIFCKKEVGVVDYAFPLSNIHKTGHNIGQML